MGKVFCQTEVWFSSLLTTICTLETYLTSLRKGGREEGRKEGGEGRGEGGKREEGRDMGSPKISDKTPIRLLPETSDRRSSHVRSSF